MPVVKESMHIGILRSANSQESAVTSNIDKASRITYCMMGAELPVEILLVWRCYCAWKQRTRSGHLHTFSLNTHPSTFSLWNGSSLVETPMDKIENFHKALLKQKLSLPDTVADPAVYTLTGTIPVEP